MTGSLRASSGALLVEQDDLHWSTLLGGIDEETLRELPLPDALDLAAAEDPSFVEDAEAWRRLFAAASDLLGWEAAGYDTTPLGMLSPGCGVRAYLAVALHRPDIELLLLDEPTNHMDIASVLWLKESLLASNKSAVLVSHDAAFMDGVCDHVWSFDSDSRHLTVSGASYSDFRRAEAIAREMQAAAYEAQQKRHRKLTAAADRLRSASEAGQFYFTKDRDKLLRDFKRDRSGRSGSKAKALDTLRDREPQIEAPVVHTPLHIDIEPLGGGSDATIILSSVLLKYPGREPLPLPPLSLRVDFGERVGIVGANGVGKSTVLRAITGQIAPCEGEARVGRELRIGNLMQEHENLCKDDTPAG